MEILKEYESYLRTEKVMRERSVSDYLFVATELSKRFDVLGPLSYRQINDAIRDLKVSKNWSSGTVYKYSICVRHFFKWLLREEYRTDNPYPFSEWRKPRPHTPKFLTPDQFRALTDNPHLSHQEMTLLLFLWDTGARIGEIASLKQENLDLEKGIVNIPYEISKGNYSYRNVPISARLIELLKVQTEYASHRGDRESIFLDITKSGLQKSVSAIGLRAGIRLSCHAFRHSAGIRWLEAQVPQVVVQKWLGHNTLQMTSRYVNMTSESSRRIFEMYVEKPA